MWMWSLFKRQRWGAIPPPKNRVRRFRRLQATFGLCFGVAGMGLLGGVCSAKRSLPSFWLGMVQPFDMRDVRLLPGPFLTAREADGRYLLSLDPDSLLYNFRVNAGLAHPGKPLGGWEAPDCEVRGHFVGHYISACSLLYRATGEEAYKQRVHYLVTELAKCQKALGGEYLSAFPTSFFDRLEAGKPVWAPYYTIHKIMAGLLDAYELCGEKGALGIAEHMAAYFKRRSDRLSGLQMERVLQTEFGGMPAVLYRLYTLTGNPNDFALAHRFDQASFLGPLALRHDDLTGIHANTHIPKILGAARRYELSHEPAYRTIVSYFWERITKTRSYATGGSNVGEYWGPPDHLAVTLAANNQETCTTYNMLKVTRNLFCWTANEKYADYYERALYNGILEAQDPSTGMMIYYTPLAAANTKQWGTPTSSFWCCYGTGVESFAKLNDSIYFHNANNLYVNLFIPSEVYWAEKGVHLVQKTNFPEADTSRFVVHAPHPVRFTLHMRVPCWTGAGYKAWLNGKPLSQAFRPGTYLVLNRVWKNGDTVVVQMPMSLHLVPMPDDKEMVAFMVGPLVLVGVITPEVRDAYLLDDLGNPLTAGFFPLKKGRPEASLQPISNSALTYRTVGLHPSITFIPLYKIIHEPYGVYWRLLKKGTTAYSNFLQAAARRAERERDVIDRVQPADAASEQAHQVEADASNTGQFNGIGWRDATGSFTWQMRVLPDRPMMLACIYWGSDGGNRVFDILIGCKKLTLQTLNNNHPGAFFEVDYPIPQEWTHGKRSVKVTFQANPGAIAGGVFRCEILLARKASEASEDSREH